MPPKRSLPKAQKNTPIIDLSESDDDTALLSPASPLSISSDSSSDGEVSVTDRKAFTNEEIEEKYNILDEIEQILLRPGMWVGDSGQKQIEAFIPVLPDSKRFESKNLTITEAFLKQFDEIIVNAADQAERTKDQPSGLRTSEISVSLDQKTGNITVKNNGMSIPVQIHPKLGCYVPEITFYVLRSGENYKTKGSLVGGQNGYGVKLSNIFSREFKVTCCCNKQLYCQRFANNMRKKDPPAISPAKIADYTEVSYLPDYQRFGMSSLDDDACQIILRRCYDVAASLPAKCKVFFKLNDGKRQELRVRHFDDYVSLFLGPKTEVPRVETQSERWKIVVTAHNPASDVTIVNSITTYQGGTHLKYVSQQLSRLIRPIIEKNKKARGLTIKDSYITDALSFFIVSKIEDPVFNSQSKACLSSVAKTWGSLPPIDEAFAQACVKRLDLVDKLTAVAAFKDDADMKKTDGKKQANIGNIPKFDDAILAGTSQSEKCVLILTEGDSAKALAVSSLTKEMRNYFGIFALRGKLINVSKASPKQIRENDEITYLKKILGLTHGASYKTREDRRQLRFGKIMIMTDQDTDGSHIKGLIFNFFYNGWRDLLESGDFITSFRTPVLKVFLSQTAKQAKTNKTNKTDKKIKKIKEPSQQQQVLSFYNKQTYVAWAAANEDLAAKATVKYYKGLGTSTPKEGREYFADIANNQIRYNFTDDSGGALEKAFAENAKSRKEILSRYDENVVIDQSLNTLTYEEFVYQEFIHYMNDSNIRAIPTIDGLKEAQRKTIFAITRQALTNETKVTEAQSLISKMTRYHHGETSMHEAIIKMAQTYKGSNNINYLKPCGQFGTVLMGGADSSAPRYLFTCVSEYARAIFHPDDDDIYDQLEDEGQSIEPAHFFPVVPMSVVNGARGTGTGYSTYIPNFNPRDVITRIRAITKREPTDTLPPMVPWYRGFQGTIVRDTKGWLCTGVVERVSTTTVNITELPIGVWIEPYVEFLSQLRLDKKIKRYDNYCAVPDEDKFSDIQIGFKIVVDPDVVDTSDQAALISLFNLTVKLPDTNMNLLIKGRVQQFSSVEKILEMYYPMRLAFYARRRENVLRKMERQETIIRNRIRFLMAVGAGELKVQQARAVVVKALEDEKFDKVDGTHDYLLDMPIYSFTSEKTDALRRQLADQIEAIRLYRAETPESLWQRDLVALEAILP